MLIPQKHTVFFLFFFLERIGEFEAEFEVARNKKESMTIEKSMTAQTFLETLRRTIFEGEADHPAKQFQTQLHAHVDAQKCRVRCLRQPTRKPLRPEGERVIDRGLFGVFFRLRWRRDPCKGTGAERDAETRQYAP